eukprot:1158244-Pelagomonas_calceolata.AAC.15
MGVQRRTGAHSAEIAVVLPRDTKHKNGSAEANRGTFGRNRCGAAQGHKAQKLECRGEQGRIQQKSVWRCPGTQSTKMGVQRRTGAHSAEIAVALPRGTQHKREGAEANRGASCRNRCGAAQEHEAQEGLQ